MRFLIFDVKDAECLKLLGLCRYMPIFLGKRFSVQSLYSGTTKNLIEHGLIKYTVDGKCLKLTCFGRNALQDMGYVFSEDSRSMNSGSKYERRVMCAETNLMFYSAGVDIFSENIKKLNGSKSCYIPFLNMRSAKGGESLSGARFAGILKSGNIAYVIYYVNSDDEIGLHISFEELAFKPLVTNLEGVDYTKIIFAGNSLEELESIIFKQNNGKCKNQSEPFSQAYEKFAYNIYMFERNKNGVMQAKIIAVPDYRKKLAQYFCVGKTALPPTLSYCDGFHKGSPLIIAVDMDLKRIYAAVKQAFAYSKLEPYILCLNFQENFLFNYLRHKEIPKAQILPIEFNKISAGLKLKANHFTNEPVRDKKGEYMTVRCRL